MDPLYIKYFTELLGTLILILLLNWLCTNIALKKTGGNRSGLLIIVSRWTFAVFVGTLITGIISRDHLKPVVTIEQALVVENFSCYEIIPYVIPQFIGTILGAIFVYIQYKDHFYADTKRSAFYTAPSIIKYLGNLVSAIIGTLVLILTIIIYTFSGYIKIEGVIDLGSLIVLPLTLLIWSIGGSLGGTKGHAINPEKNLKLRIAHVILSIKGKSSSNWSFSWTLIIGPIIGLLTSGKLFLLLQPYFSAI